MADVKREGSQLASSPLFFSFGTLNTEHYALVVALRVYVVITSFRFSKGMKRGLVEGGGGEAPVGAVCRANNTKVIWGRSRSE